MTLFRLEINLEKISPVSSSLEEQVIYLYFKTIKIKTRTMTRRTISMGKARPSWGPFLWA